MTRIMLTIGGIVIAAGLLATQARQVDAGSGPAVDAYEAVVAAVGAGDAATGAARFTEDARLVGGLACDPCIGKAAIQSDLQARIDAGLSGMILTETVLPDGSLEATIEARGPLVEAGGATRLLLKHTVRVNSVGLITEFIDEFVEGDPQNQTFITTFGLDHAADDLPAAGFGVKSERGNLSARLLLMLVGGVAMVAAGCANSRHAGAASNHCDR